MTEKQLAGTNSLSLRGVWVIESLDTVKWLNDGTQGPTPVVHLEAVSESSEWPVFRAVYILNKGRTHAD